MQNRERTWAMTAHLSTLCLFLGMPLANLLFPLLIWRWKRRQGSTYAASHALAALNFQINVTLITVVAWFTALAFPWAWLLVAAVLTVNIVLVGKAADRARSDSPPDYPLPIRWVR